VFFAGLAQGAPRGNRRVNGYAVDILRKHGHEAQINQRVIEIAFDIEKGTLEADPKNAPALIECLAAARS
jgi:2-dehydropantoate 2-reductase